MSKKSRFRWPIDRQHGKRAKTLIQSQSQLLYHICWSSWRKLSWKKSRVVTCKVLRIFVNTLTPDDKYSLLSRDNSMQTIQMQLSEKQKAFPQFFCAFFKATLNFQHCARKTTLIAYEFPKLRTPKNVVRKTSKKSRLRCPIDRQHCKRVETLI